MYGHRVDSAHHEAAAALLRCLAEGATPWAIPWPCIYEYLRVVTHPRVFHPPSPPPHVAKELRSLLASPTVRLLSETDRHDAVLARVMEESPVVGNLFHDLHIAVLLREHGVSEFLTADMDFSRFQGFRVTHPFRDR